MGFTSGFIGGLTLTTTLLYVSLSLHERNRLYQSTLLRQSSLVLNNITTPTPPTAPPTARTIVPGVAERVKERWNRELEENVRRLQRVDWSGLVTGAEGVVGRVLGRVGEEVGRDAQIAGAKIHGAAVVAEQKAEKGWQRVQESAKEGLREAEVLARKGVERVEQAGKDAVEGAKEAGHKVKEDSKIAEEEFEDLLAARTRAVANMELDPVQKRRMAEGRIG
ncbi:hypothetical protein M8818_002179 [Zalaria obscura]|uniref:Uncharacterized protein n=1 Tax=Zalaria obscura TaxID=2024903 RepID=A0ACC3SI42_9PEZI